MPRLPAPLLCAALLPLLAACAGSEPITTAEVQCRNRADEAATDLYRDYVNRQVSQGLSGSLGWIHFRATQPDC
ncbi:hypothetical protein [Azospirillum thermophilum]|nr:hypothetical protein [Azospirillum thermophilum]